MCCSPWGCNELDVTELNRTFVESQSESCLALEKTAQLCYKVAVLVSHQQ